MGTLDEVFGEMLVGSGLERMGNEPIYRGTVDSQVAEGRRQNVFVSFQDDSHPELMAPIGLAEQVGDHDLAASRTENDRCGLTTAASYVALTRALDLNRMVEEPATLIEDAIELATYADIVGARLTSRQNLKNELLGSLQGWLSDTSSVSSGMVSTETFLATVDSVLDLIPQPGLLDQIEGTALRTGLLEWAQDESGRKLSETPWNQITDGLRFFRTRRGWPELADTDS